MRFAPVFFGLVLVIFPAFSAETAYSRLKSFQFSGSRFQGSNLTLKRDRMVVHFDGVFYPEAAIDGRTMGFVFSGRGTVDISPPPIAYEKANLQRLIKADHIETDFRTAVFRFTDDTWEQLALSGGAPEAPPDGVSKLARGFSAGLLKETGCNIESRIATAILNQEKQGVLLAQFDQGKLGRFTVAFDPLGRIPSLFGLNGGEQGLVFAYRGVLSSNDIWLAFPPAAPAPGSQANSWDLLRVHQYKMQIDLTEASSAKLSMDAVVEAEVIADGVRAVPFLINQGLSEYESARLKKAMRCLSVKTMDGTDLPFSQEDWETGFTIFLPAAAGRGSSLTVRLKLQGDALLRAGDADIDSPDLLGLNFFEDVYYPRSTTSWYPVHGDPQYSRYDLAFLHRASHRAVSIGTPYEPNLPAPKGMKWSGWKTDSPVLLASFAGGRLERDAMKEPSTGVEISHYMASSVAGSDKQDYALGELAGSLQYFSQIFGPYPFKQVSAVVHPRPFGQSFPSLVLLAPTLKTTNKREFAFYAHEMAHQWWGHVVGWRTYRDQWLSEGFAEYSGSLYVRARMNRDAEFDLVRGMRNRLIRPPVMEAGLGAGRVADLGPLILGLRAASTKTRNAYSALVYAKGALVLRMLNFLLSNPATGDDAAFFTMLQDFTRRYANQSVSTEDFFQVANEHFRRSPIASKFRLQDLGWFKRQWVEGSDLPSYRLEYSLQKQDNGFLLRGTVYQAGVPGDWFMPLPLVLRFGKQQVARGTVEARGAQTPFSIPLPAEPSSVELDPEFFVLSAKTETAKQ